MRILFQLLGSCESHHEMATTCNETMCEMEITESSFRSETGWQLIRQGAPQRNRRSASLHLMLTMDLKCHQRKHNHLTLSFHRSKAFASGVLRFG